MRLDVTPRLPRRQVGKTNQVRRAEKEEKFAARKALAPFLQAEEDRR